MIREIGELYKTALQEPYLIKNPRTPDGIDGRLVVHADYQSRIAEEFRNLRTNLYSCAAEKAMQVLTITSACAHEGKTTTTMNLAAVIAQDGKDVLVIDGDLRQPAGHVFLNLKRGPGLADALQDGSRNVDKLIQKTTIERLSFLASGDVLQTPAELLSRPCFKEILEEVRPHFSYVLIDTPPARTITDACIIASKCDAVLLVVKANMADRSAILETYEQLRYARANVIGTVFLNAPVVSSERDYYYYYYNPKSSQD